MSYDLLEEKWIPVRCKSGARRFIAPWQIVEVDDPPVDIDTGRPDFDCAGIQFLIGLLQTAFTPPDEASWRRFHDRPPSAAQLRTVLGKLTGKFELLGDGPRFMQDSGLASVTLDKDTPGVRDLLIDFPTGSTLDQNKDHFVKRADAHYLSAPAAAFALLALQLNAPEGGSGNFTSLRGGGPLSTWICGVTLWQTAWRNVLSLADWSAVPGARPDSDDLAAFPWLHTGTTSARFTLEVRPDDCARVQHYWAMPRRKRLVAAEVSGQCPVFADAMGVGCSQAISAPNGYYYKDEFAFQHPLSPHRIDRTKDGTIKGAAALKGRRDAASYENWPDLVLAGWSRRTDLEAALVVRVWATSGVRNSLVGNVRVAGFDMKQNSARAWVQGELPVIVGGIDQLELIQTAAIRCVAAAKYAADQLKQATRDSYFKKGDARHDKFFDPKKRSRLPAWLDDRFWSATETTFYSTISALRDAIVAGHQVPDDPIQATLRTAWCQTLHASALALFDEASQLLGQWESADIRRIAEARKWLMWHTKPDGDAMLIHVGLKAPDLEAKPKSKRAKGAK